MGLIHHGLDAPDGVMLGYQGVGRNRRQHRRLSSRLASHQYPRLLRWHILPPATHPAIFNTLLGELVS